MSLSFRAVAAFAAALGAAPAGAHPHIFVDTGLDMLHDGDGRLVAVRVTWTYDELFSLLLLEDLGLDADFDGILTEAEEAALQGFDMDWPEGYDGDLHVTAGGAPVGLGPPGGHSAELLAGGMLRSVHVRPLDRAIDPAAEAVVVSPYDKTFYTAYEIDPADVSTERADCVVEVFTPDLDAAYARLEAALDELAAEASDPLEPIDFPPVGDRFAEEARLTCGSGS
jgi:polyphosphate kinase